nr:unnamed protein product [Digitaria exilis]
MLRRACCVNCSAPRTLAANPLQSAAPPLSAPLRRTGGRPLIGSAAPLCSALRWHRQGGMVTLSLAAKAYANSLSLCKETFFSPQMDDELVLRYQALMKESSKLPLLNLRKLNASLPVPSVPDNTTEILVMGASNDFIVDSEGLSETSRFYGVQPEL